MQNKEKFNYDILDKVANSGGSRGDYYGVLRGATAVGTPGLILEHSFHTNTAIAAWLLDENHLERLARAQAAGYCALLQSFRARGGEEIRLVSGGRRLEILSGQYRRTGEK